MSLVSLSGMGGAAAGAVDYDMGVHQHRQPGVGPRLPDRGPGDRVRSESLADAGAPHHADLGNRARPGGLIRPSSSTVGTNPVNKTSIDKSRRSMIATSRAR